MVRVWLASPVMSRTLVGFEVVFAGAGAGQVGRGGGTAGAGSAWSYSSAWSSSRWLAQLIG